MRELKFRAWDNHKKEWLMGYQYGNRGFSLIGELVACREWSAVVCGMVRGDFGEHGEHLIVQQFTGMKDSNGKEIYEGDILDLGCDDEKFEVIYNEIDNDHVGFLLESEGGRGDWFSPRERTIIGNINENPELII